MARPKPLGAPIEEKPALNKQEEKNEAPKSGKPAPLQSGQPNKVPESPATAKENSNNSSKPVYNPIVFPEVKEMQTAIYNFGKIATDIESFSMSSSGKQQTEEGTYLGGHDPFSKFMFQNYLSTDKNNGQSFVSVDNLNQKTRMDTAQNRSEVSNLRNWIDTIRRIGSPSVGSELKPDGIWGPRTNNALKAIGDFAQMMFGMAKDFGVSLDSSLQQKVSQFRSMIPQINPNGSVQGDVRQLSKSFTDFINYLSQMVGNFKKNILNNPQIKDYISQEKPLFGNSSKMNDQERTVFVLNDTAPIPLNEEGVKSVYNGITLKDLSSKEKFSEFINKKGLEIDSPEKMTQILNLIRSYIDKGSVL